MKESKSLISNFYFLFSILCFTAYCLPLTAFELRVLYSDRYRTIVQLHLLDFQIESMSDFGNLYRSVRLPASAEIRTGTTFDIGKPELPAIFRVIGLPAGASCVATVLHTETDTIKGLIIYPLQPPTTEAPDADHGHEFVIDRAFYSADELYPIDPVCIDNPGVWRDVSVAVLRFFPFAYNPGTRSLIVYKKLVVEISHRGDAFLPKKVSPSYFRMYKSAILNFDGLGIEKEIGTPHPVPLQFDSTKYLVIAYDSLIPPILPLVDWHHKRGINIKVVPICSVGTTPEAIKSYISHKYYECGLEYVLFVGDVEHIPLYSWDTYPSQYWYACITGDSVPDLYPDLVVSRFSVKDTAELAHQVTKTLNYMKTPPLDQWLTRSLLCAHRETSPDNYATFKENIRNYSYSFFNPTFDTAYGRSNGRTAQVLSAINEGRNIINYRGHGSSISWNSWDSNGDCLYDTDIMYLQNTRTPIVLNLCCATGNIENWTDCLCETWMKAEGGAIATYGATRVTNTEPHNIFDELFYKSFCDTLPGLFCVGDIIYFSYAQTVAYGPQAEANAKQCILLGDPMIEVATGIPDTLLVQHDSLVFVWESTFVVTVTTQDSLPIKDALVCLIKQDEVYFHGPTNNDGCIVCTLAMATPGTLSVTATIHGYLPYEGYAFVETIGVDETTTHKLQTAKIEVYPNPFVRNTVIRVWGVGGSEKEAGIKIYDITGRVIRTLPIPNLQSPITKITWDGTNSDGKPVGSGIYFFKLVCDHKPRPYLKKAILIR